MTEHLRNNNETYLSHFLFAGKIGVHLVFRGMVFISHAVFPIYDIPTRWNLENLQQKTGIWNKYTVDRVDKE
jgi:hypothetical protein